MIIANGNKSTGDPFVLIGITSDEIVDLMGRKVCTIDGHDIGYDVEFVIVAGSTNDAILRSLRREGVLTEASIQRDYTEERP